MTNQIFRANNASTSVLIQANTLSMVIVITFLMMMMTMLRLMVVEGMVAVVGA